MIAFALLYVGITCSLMLAALGQLTAGLIVLAVLAGLGWLLESHIFTVYGAGESNDPYMTRLVLGRFRLHIFWRGDQDPDPHDHPWGFWTFPLVTYEEEVTTGVDESIGLAEFLGLDPGFFVTHQVVKAWHPHYRPAEHTHRVLHRVREVTDPESPFRKWEPVPGPIVTLVWTERVSRKWGFLKNRDGIFCWVPWRQYIFEGGRDAPCSR